MVDLTDAVLEVDDDDDSLRLWGGILEDEADDVLWGEVGAGELRAEPEGIAGDPFRLRTLPLFDADEL